MAKRKKSLELISEALVVESSEGSNAALSGRHPRGFTTQAKPNQETILVACGRVVEK